MHSVAVIGLGYTGLPLAREACRAGMRVMGIDENPSVTATLNSGHSHVPDVTDADLAAMLDAGFRVSADENLLAEASVAVICVPTPLDDRGSPDLSHVRCAAGVLGDRLKPGTLVVLESTSFPGTTDDVVRSIVEKASGLSAGRDFALAFSPERIDPGNAHLRRPEHPARRGWLHPAVHGGRGRFLPAPVRPGRGSGLRARGRTGEAPGKHVPQCEHRPGQ